MSLIECVPNVSEGRGRRSSRRWPVSARDLPRRAPARLLLRSVAQPLGRSRWPATRRRSERRPRAVRACAVADIDLRDRTAASTRASAPSTSCRSFRSRDRQMAECVALARRGRPRNVAERFGVPVYLYEEAASNPARRQNLEDIRRGEFEGLAAKMAARGAGRPTSARRRRTRPPARRSSARACRSSPTTSTWRPTGSTSRRRSPAAIRAEQRRLAAT